jgi:hypothetical protein
LIEIEVQNETHQTQERIRFAAVPRIGEGIRLREPDGCWASYDVLDLWYQKAEYGDVWVPFLHVCMTPSEQALVAPSRPVYGDVPLPTGRSQASQPAPAKVYQPDPEYGDEPPVYGEEEFEPFTG